MERSRQQYSATLDETARLKKFTALVKVVETVPATLRSQIENVSLRQSATIGKLIRETGVELDAKEQRDLGLVIALKMFTVSPEMMSYAFMIANGSQESVQQAEKSWLYKWCDKPVLEVFVPFDKVSREPTQLSMVFESLIQTRAKTMLTLAMGKPKKESDDLLSMSICSQKPFVKSATRNIFAIISHYEEDFVKNANRYIEEESTRGFLRTGESIAEKIKATGEIMNSLKIFDEAPDSIKEWCGIAEPALAHDLGQLLGIANIRPSDEDLTKLVRFSLITYLIKSPETKSEIRTSLYNNNNVDEFLKFEKWGRKYHDQSDNLINVALEQSISEGNFQKLDQAIVVLNHIARFTAVRSVFNALGYTDEEAKGLFAAQIKLRGTGKTDGELGKFLDDMFESIEKIRTSEQRGMS